MEMKRTETMEELRVYMVNTESIYNEYMRIVKEIVCSDTQQIRARHRSQMSAIARDAVQMYKDELGFSIGRIGKNQIASVANEILNDEVLESKTFYAQYGHF